MHPSFLGAAPVEVVARLKAAVATAGGGPVVVNIGDEILGCCNIGVDVSPPRRSAAAARSLRLRVRAALEGAGVVMAETALAPRVPGQIRGTVRVAVAAVSNNDSSHLLQSPRRGRGEPV